jgi:Ca-activated chloride channel family protein
VEDLTMSVSRSGADVPSHHPRRPADGTPSRGNWLLPTVLLTVVVLAAAGFVSWRLFGTGVSSRCTGSPDTIFVAAAPDTAPVLDPLAHRWNATHPTYQGQCIAAEVVPKDPSQVANALGPNWDTGRDGTQPDVWVPDSSLWLDVAASRPDAAAMLAAKPTSLASSPVVLALRRPVAQALGWPQTTLGWTDVLGAFVHPDGWPHTGHPEWASLRVGMPDPAVSTPGIAAVLALLDQAGTGTVSDAQFLASIGLTQSLGAVAANTSSFFDAQKSTAGQGLDAVAAFPALERDVAAHDADSPASALVPIYLPHDPVVADFPYAVLTANWVDPAHRVIAGRFLDYLRGAAGQSALRAARLRTPDQTVGAAPLPADQGFQPAVAAPRKEPGPAALSQIVGQWTALQRRSNVLVVLDTSGSMGESVPGTALTRLRLLQQTAGTGYGLLTNQTSIGLWEFSSRPGQTSEYRDVVPYGPLGQPVGAVPRQKALLDATNKLDAAGFTPLYDTVYAAFHDMQARWQPNGTNAVLVITDGANEYQHGLDLPQLLDRLTREGHPDKPVPVIGIAVGPDADAAALQQVSQVTGGRTFVAKDPASAAQTLVLAFAGRLH